jgi:hypothetical protein
MGSRLRNGVGFPFVGKPETDVAALSLGWPQNHLDVFEMAAQIRQYDEVIGFGSKPIRISVLAGLQLSD